MARRGTSGLEPGTLGWAAGYDILLGDLPEVVDVGALATRAAESLERSAPRNSRAARSIYGVTAVVALPYAAWMLTKLALGVTSRIHAAMYRELATLLLKGSVSIRGTADTLREAEETARRKARTDWRSQSQEETRLTGEGGPPPGQAPSSSVTTEDEGRTVSRALTRLAADFKHSVVGPVFYFSLFGVPGAIAYQVVRSLAASWGRRAEDPLGATARRIEAFATFVPSFLGGVLISGASQALETRGGQAWDAGREEVSQRRHADGGWTEGALAGALGVRIEETDGTDVNPSGRAPVVDDLPRARRLFFGATAGAVGAGMFVAALRTAARRR